MIEWGWIHQCDQWMYGFKAKLDEVLVEYEGPHLAIFSGENDTLYFGIFCDFIDGFYRWMLSEISGAERIAILSGATELIDVFNKRNISFCDFDDNYSAKIVWHCSFEQIPASLLPKKGQPLPSFAQRPISELVKVDLKETMIKLDGHNIKNHSLPFRDLGQFLVIFQDFWEKLSQASLDKLIAHSPSSDSKTLASLSFCAAVQGSVNIYFKPTIETKDASKIVALTLSKMNSIKETGVSSKMVSELGKSGLRDASKMYSILHSSGIDMLLVSEENSWFVGAEKAGNIARAIKRTTKAKEKNKIMRGHFCAGRSKKHIHSFEFVDELSGSSYKGKISPSVWRYVAISIGDSQFYEVEIEVVEKNKDDQTVEMAYTLVKVDKATRNAMVLDLS